MDDPRVQTLFKRSRHKNLSIFIISQDYYELSKKTIRCNGNIYHILKPNNFRDVINLYQDKASMDMTLNEYKLEIGTRRAQIPRKPLIFPSPNKQRQTKNFGHTEVRTLDPRVLSTMLLPTEL